MASEHPALKDFSPTWEGFKHIAGKALKWAAIGAVVLGGVALIPAAGAGIIASAVNFVTGLFGVAASTPGTTLLLTALTKGAAVGAVLGWISGVGGVAKAIEERKMDRIEMHENIEAYEEKRELLSRQRAVYNGQGGNLSPNVGYGRGNDRGAVRGT
jgi:hypothetical protein